MTAESAYRDDLAHIHDVGYGGIARDAARRLVAELARAGHDDGTVVDLGCGSGILAQQVLEAGYAVLGLDASRAMVALARRRAPDGAFRVASFVSAPLPACVAVTAIGEVLNYGFDPANDDGARTDLFGRVYRALRPRGLWLFDVAGPERARSGQGSRTCMEGPDWTVLVRSDFDEATRVLTRHITSFRRLGDRYRHATEIHRLTLVDPYAVLESLRSVGFEATAIASYGEHRLPHGVTAVLARKPDTGD